MGVARPPGTIWSMERAYFEFRRRFPGKGEHVYLHLALQSRYPDKSAQELKQAFDESHSLDDVMVHAVAFDFGHSVAARCRMDVLWLLPACSRCGKYRSLTLTDNFCYGCRKYPGFSACTRCHLYWDDGPKFCERCGQELWKICDGPGVPIIPLQDLVPGTTREFSPKEAGDGYPGDPSSRAEGLASTSATAEDVYLRLTSEIESLESRCARIWEQGLQQRRNYRELRRKGVRAASDLAELESELPQPDPQLVEDIDKFLDTLCTIYVSSEGDRRAEIRCLMDGRPRLLGNLQNYIGRSALRLTKSQDVLYLLRGLAAASLDDGRSHQDLEWGLDSLYVAAANAGLSPSHYFKVMAQMCSADLTGIRSVLEGFENSSHFAKLVKPRLNPSV